MKNNFIKKMYNSLAIINLVFGDYCVGISITNNYDNDSEKEINLVIKTKTNKEKAKELLEIFEDIYWDDNFIKGVRLVIYPLLPVNNRV